MITADVTIDCLTVSGVYYLCIEQYSASYTGPYTFALSTGNISLNPDTPDEENPNEETSDEIPFIDVTVNAWYFNAVIFVYQNNIFSGTSSTAFTPNGNMDRGMVAQVLYNMEGKPAVSGSHGFTDVKSDAYYRQAVTWAKQNEVVAGTNTAGTTYEPTKNVTREQFAQMLYNYATYKGVSVSASTSTLNQFSDRSSISSWARNALAWCVSNGIMSGKGDGVLDPGGTATRAEAASMLMKFSQLIE